MRPPEFTGGNIPRSTVLSGLYALRFNEAAGIHRRKPRFAEPQPVAVHRFNEAAGIHRRKQDLLGGTLLVKMRCFNEAAGIHRRKRRQSGKNPPQHG